MITQGWRYYIDVEGRSIEAPEGEVTIGRSRNCTVAVKDVTVSRHHATIWLESGQAKIKDMGSSNGTFVNGRRVPGELSLGSGDRVAVGETELVVRLVEPAEPAEATVRIELGQLFCSRCGAPLPRGASTCIACGQPAAAQDPAAAPTVVGPQPTLLPIPQPAPAPMPAPPPLPEPPVFAPAPPAPAPFSPPPPLASSLPPRTLTPPPPGPLPSAPAPVFAPSSGPAAYSPPPPRSTLLPTPTAAPTSPVAPVTQVAPGAPGAATPPREMLPSIREIELAPPPPAPVAGRRPTAAPIAALAPAGFWIRFAAYLIDALVLSALYLLVAGPFFMMGRYGLAANLGGLTMFVAGLALAIVGWGQYGTTPGKYVLRLQVVAMDSRGGRGIGVTKALIRWLGYLLGGLLLGIGFLLIAFRGDKRGLHDLLAGTYVGRRR